MHIKHTALAAQLRNPALAAVYLLTGQDIYLTNQSVEQIKARWCVDEGEPVATNRLSIEQMQDWHSLVDQAQSYALFTQKTYLEAHFEKKTLDNSAKQLLQHYLANSNPACLIVIRAPLLTTKQLSVFNATTNLMVVQHSALSAAALQQWLEQQLKQISLVFTPAISSLIMRYTSGNQLACAQLLEKLRLIYQPGDSIQLDDVQAHLIDQCDFQLSELSEACLLGKPAKAFSVLRQAERNRTEITLVLWMMTQDVRRLIQLQHYAQQGISFNVACQKLTIWAQKTQLYAAALKRLNPTQLANLLVIQQQLDAAIKLGQTIQPWQTLERMILAMC